METIICPDFYTISRSPRREIRLYVLLRLLCTIARGGTERGSMYVQIHTVEAVVEVPSFRFCTRR